MAHDVVITASNIASAAALQKLIARGDRIVGLEFIDGCSMRLLLSSSGIGRDAAAQIARTKMAASSIQRITMSQIPITGLCFGWRRDVPYFSGATSTSFFSMPLVAATLPLLVLQQAALSAPHEEQVCVATDCLALP